MIHKLKLCMNSLQLWFLNCFQKHKQLQQLVDYYQSKFTEEFQENERKIKLAKEQIEEHSLSVVIFDFIRQCRADDIYYALQHELPATIACVIAQLDPIKGAYIISQIPTHEAQSDVIHCLATMRQVNIETLRSIEMILEKRITQLDRDRPIQASGVECTVEVLNLVDYKTRKEILESIEDCDPELGEQIKERLIILEDVLMLDKISLRKFLSKMNLKDIAIAMTNIDKEVVDYIYKNLWFWQKPLFYVYLLQHKNTRPKDYKSYQTIFIQQLIHLDSIGELHWPYLDSD